MHKLDEPSWGSYVSVNAYIEKILENHVRGLHLRNGLNRCHGAVKGAARSLGEGVLG